MRHDKTHMPVGKAKKKIDGVELARQCARYADDKKAENLLILDVSEVSPMTDYYVICSATSSPHLRAVRDEIAERLKEEYGMAPLVSDGGLESQWLVLVYSDVMVHVFAGEKRDFYALEELWSDAPQVPVEG